MSRWPRGLVFTAIAFFFLADDLWAYYTEKAMEDPGTQIRYKHVGKSFTSPFDYQPEEDVPRAAVIQKSTGQCNRFTFNGTESSSFGNEKLTYLWDFGDGASSDQPVAVHAYDKAGEYQVRLTVKDSSGLVCDSGIAAVSVFANFSPAVDPGPDVRGCVGETVRFDGSKSTASGPAQYQWDFGDGQTGQGVRVSHVYSKPGQYRVVLSVNDERKTECSVSQGSLTARIADRVTVALKGPQSSCAGKSLNFMANSTGGANKYQWDFGDGTTLAGASRASHAYVKGGNYRVSVTADNGQAYSCSVARDSQYVKIYEPPVAKAGKNAACCVGKRVDFDGTGSISPTGTPLTYLWDFGDGTTSTEAKATHTYEKGGVYRVTLTVRDDSNSECSTSVDSFMSRVNANPRAVIRVQ